MANPFAFASKKAAGPDQSGTHKPGFWTILDGVLGGDTISEAAYKARGREASLADLAQKTALREKIASLIAGSGDDEGAAPAEPAPPRMAGPGLDGEPVGGPAPAAMPVLPKRRSALNIDSLLTPLTLGALSGDEGSTKAAEVISKLRPDLDKGMFIGPDGRVRLREGFADAAKAASGATTGGAEGAKAEFDVMDVKMPDGSSVQMPRGVFIQLQKTGQFPQLGRAQTPGDKVSQEEGAKAPFQMVTVKLPDGSEEQVTLDEFRSIRGGATGAGAGGQGAPRQAGGFGRSQSPADSAYAVDQAKTASTRFKTLQDEGNRAPSLISKYRQLDALLGNLEGGKFTPAGLEIASALNSLGFKMDAKASNAQAADSIAKQITLDSLGGSLGTAISNGDRDFIDRTQPGLQNSAAGRRTLIDMQIKTLERKADVAARARAWQQRFGRIDTPDASGRTFDDYLAKWADRNPLFTKAAK